MTSSNLVGVSTGSSLGQAHRRIMSIKNRGRTMKQAALRPESYTKKVALVLQGGGALGSAHIRRSRERSRRGHRRELVDQGRWVTAVTAAGSPSWPIGDERSRNLPPQFQGYSARCRASCR